MKIAAVDLGTNTCLLLVAEVSEDGVLTTLRGEQRLPRLGTLVDSTGMIHEAAFDRVAAVLKEYSSIARGHGIPVLTVCATSALRDARNAPLFLERIRSELGIVIEVISGEEEALLTYKGALCGLNESAADRLVIDIGGGSTEISHPVPGTRNGSTKLVRYSLQIGAVRLTERLLKHAPPHPSELSSARELIMEELAQVRNPGFERFEAVGVAGSVTTLACLDQGLDAFDAAKVGGYLLRFDRVDAWLRRIAQMAPEEIRALSTATAGREDIMTAGLLILREIMAVYRIGSIRVSEKGLRYGIVLREWARRAAL
jgi:exopolyphosphatase/guanosine-5'-triphosphate,3'-diphosphate pyrophosphatase